MMERLIYLDNAATTRPYSEVVEIMTRTMEKDFGNPSSLHKKGMEAERYITRALEAAAESLRAEKKEIIFTSGGTESNNMALIGAALANQRSGKHIITTQIEHPSVYQPLLFLESMGFEVTFLSVDQNGHISQEELKDSIREDTALVSVMMVNNEMGAVAEIGSIAAAVKERNPKTLLHVDAIQAYGKYKISPRRMGIDLLSVSGHKIHGPKGVGFLYAGERVKIKPILYGGGQQGGMRSGTENVPGIAGLGIAIEKTYDHIQEKQKYMYGLKEKLIKGLLQMERVEINGMKGLAAEAAAPHIVSAGFAGIRSEVLLHALDERGICVSSGSACSSHHPKLNGTLKAAGISPEWIEGTLRFSFCADTKEEDINETLEALQMLVPQLRRLQRK